MSLNHTKIEWVKNPDGTQGYTWNPITGCLNHTPEGLCLGGMFPCYAYKLANGRLRGRYLGNTNIAGDHSAYKENVVEHLKDPFYPRFWEERLMDKDFGNPFDPSYARMKPKGVFVCDMGELFGDWIPQQWQASIFTTIARHPYDRFYLLTKQPQNLPKWSPFPDNCWVGVTATDAKSFLAAGRSLEQIEAKVKYVSLEPLLDYIGGLWMEIWLRLKIDWLIIGACTGTRPEMEALIQRYPELTLMPYGKKWTAQPKIEWVAEIVKAADQAGIPVFLKDNLRPIIAERQKPFWYVDHFESHLRQEMPG